MHRRGGLQSALTFQTSPALLLDYRSSTIAEVFEAVRDIQLRWNSARDLSEELWFRGASAPYRLEPSLYRPAEIAAKYDEGTLIEKFRALGAPLAGRAVSTDWDWYFLARHHGIPTRLLDWSSNLHVALFFSIQPLMASKKLREVDTLAMRKGARAKFDGTGPVLWVLEPTTLNMWSIQHRAMLAVSEDLSSMLPENLDDAPSPKKWTNRRPVAILPPHTNPRLVAQGGRFTLHGQEKKALDMIATDVKKVLIAKIELPKDSLPRMWDELDIGGVNAATLMQDLDTLASYLKYTHDRSE